MSAADGRVDVDVDTLAAESDGELGSLEQALQNCANPDGTNAVMAAFAVAVGQELKRWESTKDFVMFTTSGQSESSPGMQQAIKLTSGTGPDGKPRGKSRCADGKCAKVQAILDMQYEQARGKIYIQGETSQNKVLLDPAALRSRMVAKANYEQKTCDDNAKDGDANRCPKEAHVLTPIGTVSLGGCGVHYKFGVKKDTGAALQYPAQLKGKLTFADQTNGWVDFRNLGGGYVAIDPTSGLNEGVTTTSGSCTSGCTRISTTNVAGQCCSCGGATKKFVKTTFNANTYLCQ
ncbi:MAG TPA: hypothetical protein VMG12_38660 [Polyangiaceae bacterium]|nr:hypothetical protein [Polyangiaceae bacterium]